MLDSSIESGRSIKLLDFVLSREKQALSIRLLLLRHVGDIRCDDCVMSMLLQGNRGLQPAAPVLLP